MKGSNKQFKNRPKKRDAFDAHAFLDSAGVAKKVRQFKRAEIVFSQGSSADSVMYIQAGGVKITALSAGGKEAIVAILGPGLVRNFARMGILLPKSSQVRVERVTAADNCFSGILVSGTTDSDIARNVSVRNFGFDGTACGGT